MVSVCIASIWMAGLELGWAGRAGEERAESRFGMGPVWVGSCGYIGRGWVKCVVS
jgi:hypothetical protein